MEISALAPTAVDNRKSTLSAAKLADTFDKFLTLLTTQLRFQDPLDPMESNEFVTQLVQFTNVEQAIGTNRNLEDLIELQSKNRAVSALGFIGHTVEASGRELPLVGGAAELTYTLPAASAATAIMIANEQGQAVFTAPGETAAGKHGFVWDGKDKKGNQLPDGAYRVVVAARDANEAELDVVTGVVARVTSVETTDDSLRLSLGPVAVPFEKVVSVRETGPAAGG